MTFTEHDHNGLVWLTAPVIGAKHAFTTRLGGVSGGPWASLNLGDNRGDDLGNVRENYRRLGAALGADLSAPVRTRQVHGREVRVVTDADRCPPGVPVPYEADGLVTGVPGLPLMCFIADCVPVLLWEPRSGTAGAIHCGWRSSVQDILGAAAEKMAALGADPRDIRAAVGPSIGACCFETDGDVPEALRNYLGAEAAEPFILPAAQPGKYRVDLRGANAARLLQLGLRPEHIAVSDACTVCSPDRFWSHRAVNGGVRGSQCAVILL